MSDKIYMVPNPPTPNKVVEFNPDICSGCNLCVEVCPTDAVFFTREFEGATFEYRTLVREFISPELSLERLQLAEETKKKVREKKDRKEKGEETKE